MSESRRSYGRSEFSSAQYSRLFIVCSRDLTSDDFYKHFDKFGKIEEVRIVKDRQTGESKGIAYVKFTKTSEAAKALDEMNGKVIGASHRPIKVLVASSLDQGSRRDSNEGEKYIRLFVVVPKSMKDEELTEYFQKFGPVQYASVIRDKNTNESKGFAYIKYQNFYHAALAFENCDRSYRAVFAEPRPSRKEREFDRGTPFGNNDFYPNRHETRNDNGGQQLIVTASPTSNQDQLWRLFDLIPGLDYCQPASNRSNGNIYVVVYNSLKAAQIAREKLHGFEYPPGYRLIVRMDSENIQPRSDSGSRGAFLRPPETTGSRPDIVQLAETIAQATSLIQAAGININQYGVMQKALGNNSVESQWSVQLPPVQRLAPMDANVAMRCFIVCSPQALPIHVMRDAFCRFGDLIDVYFLSNKNCGYAKYASVDGALEAMKVMHGSEFCGVRLKVLEAEEQRKFDHGERRKRMRRSESPEDDGQAWT